MSGFAGVTYWAVPAVALLWLCIASAISFAAARRFAIAQGVLGAARSNARLLELMPARPLVVRADGRIEADAQLVRELGLRSPPARLADLVGNDSGILAEDLEVLLEEVEAARVSASKISRKVRMSGSGRVFEVRGGPAPAPEPAGTLLLWFFDTSAGEEERARLGLRLRQTEGALNSLTHLIEAAPFPMWYRGPDLKLGLVNSAFVHAVEGKDASDVIDRDLELIDAEGADSASATAQIQGHIGESSPTMEAVQEFSVQTSGMSAEYGRTSGGVFNFALKSGTNQLHGSAFYYGRNEALNANTWMNNWQLSQCQGNAACEDKYQKPRDPRS